MFNMRVEEKNPVVPAQMTYDEKRKHLRSIIFDEDNDLTLTRVGKWIGKESRSKYKYLHQVISGYPGKKSKNVLDQVEKELRKKGYYELP